jgi:hypothetical protein
MGRIRWLPYLFLIDGGQRAFALIYLPENTLESMLVRSDAVVIGTVSDFSDTDNRGTVEEVLKGNATGALQVTGVMLRVDTKTRRPRFAKGDRIIVFCNPVGDSGSRSILHSQTLANAAEVRTMKGCVAEIMPVAQLLTDLADHSKPFAPVPLHAALKTLVVSKNAYTQILVGRLLDTRLSESAKPDGWEDVLLPALASPRKELVKGALTWAGKYEKLPAEVRGALEKIVAGSGDEEVKGMAKGMVGK